MLEASLGTASTPTLTALAERAVLGRATSTFPSLTPVCLSSIATGAHPDVHEIPHLIWWHRGERRLVEYGSSFGAVRAAGLGRALRDTLVGMNAEHLGRRRGDGVRGAGRRRRPNGRGQLHRLSRQDAPPAHRPVPRPGARAGAVLLLQPLPERAHGRAPLVPEPRRRHDRRLRRGGRALARDARRLRLPPALPLRLRLRLARLRAPTRRRRCSRGATRRSATSCAPRAVWTSSLRGMP